MASRPCVDRQSLAQGLLGPSAAPADRSFRRRARLCACRLLRRKMREQLFLRFRRSGCRRLAVLPDLHRPTAGANGSGLAGRSGFDSHSSPQSGVRWPLPIGCRPGLAFLARHILRSSGFIPNDTQRKNFRKLTIFLRVGCRQKNANSVEEDESLPARTVEYCV